MLFFEGSGYKDGKTVSRDSIIKSGYKNNADVFKVNKVLASFNTYKLLTKEAMEYIMKDSIDQLSLNTPAPTLSDFGLNEKMVNDIIRIKYIALLNIITVVIFSLIFGIIAEKDLTLSVLFFLVIYCGYWGYYFICNKAYNENIARIDLYNDVISFYNIKYNKLLEIEKEKERRREEVQQRRINEELKKERKRDEEIRKRLEEERKRRELQRKARLEYWKELLYNDSLSTIEKGYQFEKDMAELFSNLGYESKVTRASKDGGVDIVLKKDNETILVQCKLYKEGVVSSKDVQALWGATTNPNNAADKAIMLTYAGVSRDAENFINEINQGKKGNDRLYLYYDIYGILNLYEEADRIKEQNS